MVRARSRKSRTSERGSTLRFVLVVVLVAWLFRSLIFAPFSIPSGSMLPTLYIGDYVVAAKWPYGFSRYSFPFAFPPFPGRVLASLPERGDVVVFRPDGAGSDLIKRVIALPGDTVEMRNGSLLLNGRRVARSGMQPVAIPITANSPCRVVAGASQMIRQAQGQQLCVYPTYVETLPTGVSYRIIDQVDGAAGDDFPETKVAAGKIFVMGDNRDDSFDSRFSAAEGGIGFVPMENVIGRATMVFWSTDGSAGYLKPWTWFSALRADRIGKTFEAGE